MNKISTNSRRESFPVDDTHDPVTPGGGEGDNTPPFASTSGIPENNTTTTKGRKFRVER